MNYMRPLMLSVLSIVTLLVATFCISIPQAVSFYGKWKQNGKTNAFSAMVLMGIISIVFIVVAYKIGMNLTIDYGLGVATNLPSSWATALLPIFFIFLLITLIQAILIPKSVHYFNRWKSTNSPTYFSVMTFLGVATFFCFSCIFCIVFKPC